MSDQKLESWPIERLVPYDKNAKKHSEEDILKLVEAIKSYGFNTHITVDKNGVIIAGHGRRLAAMRLGMKFLPVQVLDHLTEEEVKAHRLSENKVTGVDYDYALEQGELEELSLTDVDMSAIGYSDKELDFLTEDLTEMDMDSLIDDLDEEVAKQTERVEEKAKETEAEMVAVGDALGFKRVTVETARIFGQFMSKLEEQSGLKGEEALKEFASSLVSED